MNSEWALAFAHEWEAAWNSHDLERILTPYADDVIFESPHIRERFGRATGEVQGKAALAEYWGAGLQREGNDLHFTVEDVRCSINTIVINYRNQHGHAVAEVLRFRDRQVVWGCGAYAPSP
jgi:ketosteroid isomerase-like protein